VLYHPFLGYSSSARWPSCPGELHEASHDFHLGTLAGGTVRHGCHGRTTSQTFKVSGHEKGNDHVRDCSGCIIPRSGPKATLWDEWLPDASLWPAVETENHIRTKCGVPGTTPSRVASSTRGIRWPRINTPTSPSTRLAIFPSGIRAGAAALAISRPEHGGGSKLASPHDLSKTDGWTLTGASDAGIRVDGWRIEVTKNAAAIITAKPGLCHTFECSFCSCAGNYRASRRRNAVH